MSAREYVIIIERTKRNYGAYVPDLPGCVAVGDTRRETLAKMRSAIDFHLEGLREDGLPIPKPTTTISRVRVNTPTSRSRSASRPRSASRAASAHRGRPANGRSKRV